MNLDRAISQRFSAQDAPVKKSCSHMVERRCGDVMKWYTQMPTWNTRSLSLESVPTCSHKRLAQSQTVPTKGRAPRWDQEPTTGLRLSKLVREAEELLSEALKTIQRGMVKRGSYESMWQSVFVSLCPSVSLTPQEE